MRILIVTDTRLYREGLTQMLERHFGSSATGSGTEREDIAAQAQQTEPDVIVVDVATRQGEEDHQIVRELRGLVPLVPLVVLGIGESESDALACMEAGATGYVTREGSLDDLVNTIESAKRGELRCSPRIAGSLLRRAFAAPAGPEPLSGSPRLTSRELEILDLINGDLSNKQIAVHLGIEVATVKNHVHNILEKLNVRRRVDAARLRGRASGWGQRLGQPALATRDKER